MMPPTTIVSPLGTLTEVLSVRVMRGGGIAPEKEPTKFDTSSETFRRR
jgi:hypothetical protein